MAKKRSRHWANLLRNLGKQDSNATGSAELQILPDLNTISYIIDASGINNVTDISMSIDMGTGRYPDVVSIRSTTSEGIMQGPTSGPLAEGNFTASDLTGALSGARVLQTL